MQRRFVGPAIDRRDLDQDVFDVGFRVLDEHIEIAVLVENAGVDQLVLRLALRLRRPFSSTRWSYGNSACGYLYSIFI